MFGKESLDGDASDVCVESERGKGVSGRVELEHGWSRDGCFVRSFS